MLPVTYDLLLVCASILVAIMASFTGLRLASGLSALPPQDRKREIAKAAVALGGGIWSMHFVGMLAVSVPVTIQYDALPTLGSVLIAILITGSALAFLHFGERTWKKMLVAGVLMGLGIVTMHYVGMSAISGNCAVDFEIAGYVISTAIAIASSTAALWLAYQRRTVAQIALGSVVLGLAISAMHYSAMYFTTFSRAGEISIIQEPNLSTGNLALVVALSTFVICGLFLLTAIPGTSDEQKISAGSGPPVPEEDEGTDRLPYEHNNMVMFVPVENISAVKADGHYSKLFDGENEMFCPWPISKVEAALQEKNFLRTHRSFLVNVGRVKGFHRVGDKGFCVIDPEHKVEVPVSRSRVSEIQSALGMK
ncbi:MAG: MHYT domain-containing protein [Hyphomicrobiales bacterium]